MIAIHLARLTVVFLALSPYSASLAATFVLDQPAQDIVGQIETVDADPEQTLLDIARRHGIGQEEMRRANPTIDRWLPARGSKVTIPGRYIIPDGERSGLMLNLPEMRLYEFAPGSSQKDALQVHTFPASIGRMDWKTPLGEARIVRKQRRPSWHPPASVRKEAAASGESLPEVIPPGPDNPLGDHALRLNLPGYLIHGTNKPFGVGMRVTHGCVRMLPEDIAELFKRVDTGTKVQILNQPVKTGWQDDILYIEIHPPLDEDTEAQQNLLRYSLERVYSALEKRPAVLDARSLRQAVGEMSGVPVAISKPGVSGRPIDNPLFR
jgi:L,D-transpeptidase ErfK/SrfK